MKDLIEWLRSIEDLAHELYLAATDYFAADARLSAFLSTLADEEAWHFHLMSSARQLFVDMGDFPPPVIKIDEETRHRIEEPLRKCLDQLSKTGVLRADFLNCLAEIEFSELNDLVLYVIRACKGRHKAFQKIAAAIQGHQNRIEAFLQVTPGGEGALRELRKLPVIWENRYLVVDDEPATLDILSLLLEKDGEVLTAADGKEALDLIGGSYFDVIISDVNMPVMTGTELFERATRLDENLGRRFILSSGHVTPQLSAFCLRHQLHLLPKPYSLRELKGLIAQINEENTRP